MRENHGPAGNSVRNSGSGGPTVGGWRMTEKPAAIGWIIYASLSCRDKKVSYSIAGQGIEGRPSYTGLAHDTVWG